MAKYTKTSLAIWSRWREEITTKSFAVLVPPAAAASPHFWNTTPWFGFVSTQSYDFEVHNWVQMLERVNDIGKGKSVIEYNTPR